MTAAGTKLLLANLEAAYVNLSARVTEFDRDTLDEKARGTLSVGGQTVDYNAYRASLWQALANAKDAYDEAFKKYAGGYSYTMVEVR